MFRWLLSACFLSSAIRALSRCVFSSVSRTLALYSFSLVASSFSYSEIFFWSSLQFYYALANCSLICAWNILSKCIFSLPYLTAYSISFWKSSISLLGFCKLNASSSFSIVFGRSELITRATRGARVWAREGSATGACVAGLIIFSTLECMPGCRR